MKRITIVIGIIILVFFTLSCNKLMAQEQADGQWTTYTTSNGLPYNEVGAIAFGPDGDLWCVLVPPGGGGVAHFDGDTWEHHTNEDGLGSDVILWLEHTLTVSSDNVLWVATFEGGVSSFDGEAWTSYTTEDGLLSDKVTAVAIAPNGDVWCTHLECGISHFDGANWTVYSPDDMGVSSCNLINIAFDPDTTLWACGSHVLSFHEETWTNFSTQTGMEIALYMDIGPDGKIWIGSGGGGVSFYEESAWTHYSLADMGASDSESLMPLAVDSENVLWVGVDDENDENDEIFKYDGASWTKFAPEGGPDLQNIFSIAAGPDSTIWFGTEYGLFRYIENVALINLPYKNEDKLTVYPNPFTDWLTIKGNKNLDACISVISIMGNILLEESCENKNEVHINTTNLPKGLYFVQISSKDNITAYKMLKY